jgi:predicted RNA methylase
MAKRLSEAAVVALGSSEVAQNRLVIPEHLDRKIYTEVNKALESIGGKWNRGAKAHLFEPGVDVEQLVDGIVQSGGFTDAKAELGAFYSPLSVARRVLELADLDDGMKVLEPSAGEGALALPAKRAACDVVAYELDERAFKSLLSKALAEEPGGGHFNLHRDDFLTVKPLAEWDRVLMNPPFAKQVDIDHVRHAIRFLRPGGRLVSVMSAGVRFRENRKTVEFKAELARLGSVAWQDLPEGSFKESGTDVRTCILVFDRND